MQRGFAQIFLIVLGVLILAGAGGYIYLNSLKTPTLQLVPVVQKTISNIQTYSSSEFEFQYSKDLKVQEDTEEAFNQRSKGDFRKNFKGYVMYDPGNFLNGLVVLEKSDNFDTNPFTLWVFDNPDDLSIDNWFDKYWYYPFLWGVFDFTSKGHVALDKEATVSGLMAKYKIVAYQQASPKYVYISKEKKMYLFRIIGESGDKILSTFKFL